VEEIIITLAFLSYIAYIAIMPLQFSGLSTLEVIQLTLKLLISLPLLCESKRIVSWWKREIENLITKIKRRARNSTKSALRRAGDSFYKCAEFCWMRANKL
jgi:hypothetical protein